MPAEDIHFSASFCAPEVTQERLEAYFHDQVAEALFIKRVAEVNVQAWEAQMPVHHPANTVPWIVVCKAVLV